MNQITFMHCAIYWSDVMCYESNNIYALCYLLKIAESGILNVYQIISTLKSFQFILPLKLKILLLFK